VIVVHRLLKGTAAAAELTGFALLTGAAVEAMGLDPVELGLVAADETIDPFGPVTTHRLDLEARWAAESTARRLDIGSGEVILDLAAEVAAEPAVAWAHLTSPVLRARWEGPIEIRETSPGGRRGVGTLAQCVTGRLATLEEIVDWQPHDHVGWRLAVPALGPVAATVDIEPVGRGSHVRVRWERQGQPVLDPALAAVRRERTAAFDRLRALLDTVQPVIEQEVV